MFTWPQMVAEFNKHIRKKVMQRFCIIVMITTVYDMTIKFMELNYIIQLNGYLTFE